MGMADAATHPSHPCPTCGSTLQEVSNHGRRYCCPGCKGYAIGQAALRPLLADGAAARIWMSSAESPCTGPACPFCSHPMRGSTAPPSAAGAATVQVCRSCEMVWIDASQGALLPAAPPAGAGGPPPVPDRCHWCGAPYELTADGSCRYCHRAVVAPTVVVVAGSSEPALPEPGGFAGKVAGALVDGLFGGLLS
jgi:hypothetical protein